MIGCQDKFQHIVKKKRHWLCAHCVSMFMNASIALSSGKNSSLAISVLMGVKGCFTS